MRNQVRAKQVAEFRHDRIELVVANEAERGTLCVKAGDSLMLLSGDDLSLIHEWRVGAEPSLLTDGWGAHGASGAGPVALLSTPAAVRLHDSDGSIRWSFVHPSWVGIGTGCAWFGPNDQPYAVVPSGDGAVCRIVALDLATGAELADHRIEPYDPAGMTPLHQPEGWVGVAESEGENASRAWWVRPSESGIEVLSAPWDDEHLSDVDASGELILTTALYRGPVRLRSFPSLDLQREIRVKDEDFVFGACFVHPYIVAHLYNRAVTVAIDEEDRVEELEVDDGWIVPAAAGSWVSVRQDTLRLWSLV